jgi:hypothetical protein
MTKEFNLEDVPIDVIEVWAIQFVGHPVGLTTYERCMETIRKYPEWFPEKTEELNKNNNT